MERKTAEDNMKDFLNWVYIDTMNLRGEGCVIESWDRGGPVLVRYQDGTLKKYNDVAIPHNLIAIGKIEGLCEYRLPYDKMDESEKTIFRKQITDFIKLWKKD